MDKIDATGDSARSYRVIAGLFFFYSLRTTVLSFATGLGEKPVPGISRRKARRGSDAGDRLRRAARSAVWS